MVGEIIRARIFVFEEIGEFAAISDGAAVVVVNHYIPLRRHPLQFRREVRTIGKMRSAMDFNDQWVGFAFFITRRGDHPPLNLKPVKGRVIGEHANLAEIAMREQVFVQVGEPSGPTVSIGIKIRWTVGVSLGVNEGAAASRVIGPAHIGPADRGAANALDSHAQPPVDVHGADHVLAAVLIGEGDLAVCEPLQVAGPAIKAFGEISRVVSIPVHQENRGGDKGLAHIFGPKIGDVTSVRRHPRARFNARLVRYLSEVA